MLTSEQEVIRNIRRKLGVDSTLEEERHVSPILWDAVQNLRNEYEEVANILSDQLNTKTTHFILEAVQNADDNEYPEHVMPALRIALNATHMDIVCNEVGFSAENVEAFCRTCKSTKKNLAGYIGEKGIGAKSMFAVAKRVHVHSRGFHFTLDKTQKLGMMAPMWSEESLNPADWTLIRLDFLDGNQFDKVKTDLEGVQHGILFFTRKLSELTVHVEGNAGPFIVTRSISGNMMQMTTSGPGATSSVRRFLRISRTMAIDPDNERRKGVKETEVVLAFPLDSNDEAFSSSQMVYAFLPLSDVGFKFIIQGDFLTIANREGIQTDLPWNAAIRGAISEIFCTAVTTLVGPQGAAYSWLRFLPRIADVVQPFFAPVPGEIINILRTRAVIECSDGRKRKAASVRFPAPFLFEGAGIIPERYLLGFHYVSPRYRSYDVDNALRLLGVKDMLYSDFVSSLVRMGDAVTRQSNDWREQICSLIRKPVDLRIRKLPLAYTTHKEWLACDQPLELLFDDGLTDFPSDLDIRVLRPGSDSPNRSGLLRSLGIGTVSPKKILEIIRTRHKSTPIALTSVIEHSVYIFQNRISISPIGSVDCADLFLADSDGNSRRGSGLYMDDAAATTQLSSVLSAQFIHPDIVSPHFLDSLSPDEKAGELNTWTVWLRQCYGVSCVPRLEQTGLPSAEFARLIESLHLETSYLLGLLKEFLPGLHEQLRDLPAKATAAFNKSIGDVLIRCSNGKVVSLRSAYVIDDSHDPSDDLPRLALPGDVEDWTFLRDFGVSDHLDVKYYLKRLEAMKDSPSIQWQQVLEVYTQLAHSIGDLSEIRDAFMSARKCLFFVNGCWVAHHDVVWDGPRIMSLKSCLKPTWPKLEYFFKFQLGIQDAQPVRVVVDELQYFADHHSDAPLSNELLERLIRLLRYAKRHIKDSDVSQLQHLAIWPIRQFCEDSSITVTLAASHAPFFVPDPSEYYYSVFSGFYSFLALSPSLTIALESLLEKFGIMEKRIDLHVKESVLVNGLPVEQFPKVSASLADIKASELLNSKLDLLQRIQHFCRGTQQRMRSVSVFTVEDITVQYALGYPGRDTCSFPGTRACHCFNDERGHWNFLTVGKTAFDSAEGSAALCSALGLAKSSLMNVAMVMSSDTSTADTLLRLAGIQELDDDQDQSDSEGSDVAGTQAGLPTVARRSGQASLGRAHDAASENSRAFAFRSGFKLRSATAVPGEDLSAYIQSDAAQQEITDLASLALEFELPPVSELGVHAFPSLPVHLDVAGPLPDAGLRAHAMPETSSDETNAVTTSQAVFHFADGSTENFSDDRQVAIANTIASSLAFGGWRMHRQNGQLDVRAQHIGYLGEKFVFDVLKALLGNSTPTFTHANWTSELRKHDGATPLKGEHPADFYYDDQDGTLTRRLFPNGSEYYDCAPQYFIEVKTTSGAESEPFHMSRRQFLQALSMSRPMRTDDGQSSRLYVLFRVSNIGRGKTPRLNVYEDLHNMLSRGTLRIVSDSTEVCIVAPS